MVEHILSIKPTIDNRTPSSFLAKRVNRKSTSLIQASISVQGSEQIESAQFGYTNVQSKSHLGKNNDLLELQETKTIETLNKSGTGLIEISQSKDLSKSVNKMTKPEKEREKKGISLQNLRREFSIILRHNQQFILQNSQFMNTPSAMNQSQSFRPGSTFQGTLNFYQRKKELYKINRENQMLLKTIQGAQPTYNRVDWRQHSQKDNQDVKTPSSLGYNLVTNQNLNSTRFQNPQTPTNQKYNDSQQITDSVQNLNSTGFQQKLNHQFGQDQQINAQFFHRRVQTTQPSKRIDSVINKAQNKDNSTALNHQFINQGTVQRNDPNVFAQQLKLELKFKANDIPHSKLMSGNVRVSKSQNKSGGMPYQNLSTLNQINNNKGKTNLISLIENNQTIVNQTKPSSVTAYAEILKIYYPKGKIPKFNFKPINAPVQKLINNISNRTHSIQNQINFQTFDFEFSPQSKEEQRRDTNQVMLQDSEQKRQQLMSRQGRRRPQDIHHGQGEIKVLRNRALQASGGKQNPGIFDDRFELESRGRANATGLSGTSEPGDERDGDLAGDGVVDGLDDSGYQQTNYYNNNLNDTHGGVVLKNYDNNEDRTQVLHTQPFEDSIINHGQDEQASLKGYRDSLNMSQPVPRLDNSSMMHNSIQRDVEMFNGDATEIFKDLEKDNKPNFFMQTYEIPREVEDDDEVIEESYIPHITTTNNDIIQTEPNAIVVGTGYLMDSQVRIKTLNSQTKLKQSEIFRNQDTFNQIQSNRQDNSPQKHKEKVKNTKQNVNNNKMMISSQDDPMKPDKIVFQSQETFKQQTVLEKSGKIHYDQHQQDQDHFLRQSHAISSQIEHDYTFTNKQDNLSGFIQEEEFGPTTVKFSSQLLGDFHNDNNLPQKVNFVQESDINHNKTTSQKLSNRQLTGPYMINQMKNKQNDQIDDQVEEDCIQEDYEQDNNNQISNNKDKKYIDSDADADASEYEEINDEILDMYE
eukprot:403367397